MPLACHRLLACRLRCEARHARSEAGSPEAMACNPSPCFDRRRRATLALLRMAVNTKSFCFCCASLRLACPASLVASLLACLAQQASGEPASLGRQARRRWQAQRSSVAKSRRAKQGCVYRRTCLCFLGFFRFKNRVDYALPTHQRWVGKVGRVR
jgi:hypothetical protein